MEGYLPSFLTQKAYWEKKLSWNEVQWGHQPNPPRTRKSGWPVQAPSAEQASSRYPPCRLVVRLGLSWVEPRFEWSSVLWNIPQGDLTAKGHLSNSTSSHWGNRDFQKWEFRWRGADFLQSSIVKPVPCTALKRDDLCVVKSLNLRFSVLIFWDSQGISNAIILLSNVIICKEQHLFWRI